MFKFERLEVWHKSIALYEEIAPISQSIINGISTLLGNRFDEHHYRFLQTLPKEPVEKAKKNRDTFITLRKVPSMRL